MKFLLARPFSKRGSLLLPRMTQEAFLGRDLGGAGEIGAKNEEEELLPPKNVLFTPTATSPHFRTFLLERRRGRRRSKIETDFSGKRKGAESGLVPLFSTV